MSDSYSIIQEHVRKFSTAWTIEININSEILISTKKKKKKKEITILLKPSQIPTELFKKHVKTSAEHEPYILKLWNFETGKAM